MPVPDMHGGSTELRRDVVGSFVTFNRRRRGYRGERPGRLTDHRRSLAYARARPVDRRGGTAAQAAPPLPLSLLMTRTLVAGTGVAGNNERGLGRVGRRRWWPPAAVSSWALHLMYSIPSLNPDRGCSGGRWLGALAAIGGRSASTAPLPVHCTLPLLPRLAEKPHQHVRWHQDHGSPYHR